MFVPLENNLSFYQKKHSPALLFLVIALWFVVHGFAETFAPLLASSRGIHLEGIGWISVLHYVGYFAGALLAPLWIHKTSYKASLVWITLVFAGSFFVLPFLHSLFLWIVARFVSGLCIAFLYVTIDSWIHEVTLVKKRGTVFGFYSFLMYVALMLGAYLTGLANKPLEVGSLPLFVGFTFLLLVAISCMLWIKGPHLTYGQHAGKEGGVALLRQTSYLLWKMLRERPLGIASMLAMGITNSPFWSMGPLFIKTVAPQMHVAYFMMLVTFGNTVAQMPFGKLADKIGRERTLSWSALFACASCLWLTFLAFDQAQPFPFYVAALFYGVCASQFYILAAVLMSDVASEDNGGFVGIVTTYVLLYSIGGMMGSGLVQLLLYIFGNIRVLFLPGALCTLILFFMAQHWHAPLRATRAFVP